jgi:acetyltransferase-like isoleucine patch superfamily enzyme
LKKIATILRVLFKYLIVHKGNKVSYLRAAGAKIGDDCDILTAINNFGTEPWLIQIGNNVTLTAGVLLITHDGSSRLFRKIIEGGNKIYGNRFGTIIIGNNCFIGVNTIILPGVSVGDNCIIGAGSIVNKSTPPETVFAGNPARYICTLEEYISKYRDQMIPCQSTDRESLRRELTSYFWNEPR